MPPAPPPPAAQPLAAFQPRAPPPLPAPPPPSPTLFGTVGRSVTHWSPLSIAVVGGSPLLVILLVGLVRYCRRRRRVPPPPPPKPKSLQEAEPPGRARTASGDGRRNVRPPPARRRTNRPCIGWCARRGGGALGGAHRPDVGPALLLGSSFRPRVVDATGGAEGLGPGGTAATRLARNHVRKWHVLQQRSNRREPVEPTDAGEAVAPAAPIATSVFSGE